MLTDKHCLARESASSFLSDFYKAIYLWFFNSFLKNIIFHSILFCTRGPMHEIHARTLAAAGGLCHLCRLCLSPRPLQLCPKGRISGLISILPFYYYRLVSDGATTVVVRQS
ncbi:unnamed protein product [Pipistrellus nathusii]|uniref:Uncharacterized protein n=1 Tax=Pipistrellus nathusii TaxID=59473 RepID=A0ABP0A832_PIPNA